MLKKRFTQISFCLVMLGMAAGLAFAADIPDERRIRRLELVCRPAGEDIADLRAAQLYQARLQGLGLDVKINPMPFTSEVDYVWRQRDRWDLTNWRLTGRPERSDPDELLYNGFHSSLTKAGFNFYGYINQEVNQLLEAQRKELDVEKRKNLVWKVTETIAKDMPIAPVVALHESFAYNKKLFDENSIINQAGIGIRNYWTFTNIKPLTGMKTLIVNYPTEIRALSPFSQGGVTDQWVAQLLFDRLMRIGPDSLPKPSLAEKVTWLDDISLEVMVRKGMKFHDGQSVTAHDVAFSYELVMAGEAPEYEAYTKSIDRVELIDDYKLIFHLKKPNAAFLFSTLGKIWVGPKHIWEPIYKEIKANPTDDATSIHLKNPIGSGPMKFVAWRRGEEVILEAVGNHHRGANVEKIVFRKVSIPEIIIGQLERGELNFVAAYLGDPRLLEEVVKKNKDLAWQACSTLGNRFFAYNQRRAPFNDPAFRTAVAQVIPYEEIRQTVGLGYPIRSNSLINATLEYWFNPDIPMLSYDLEKAKSILKKAGYEWDEDGRLCYPQGQVESLQPAWGP